jgi:branched-chain amino acid transport system permease protein
MRDDRSRSFIRRLVQLAILAAALFVPVAMTDPYWLNLLVQTIIFSILALSLDVIIGHMGQFSFGHQVFFGVGAYTTAILNVKAHWPVWFSMPCGIASAGILGVLVGAVALKRTRGLYLAIITLGVGQIVWLVARNWYSLTGGISGIPMIDPVTIDIPGVGSATLGSETSYYYFALAALVLTIYLVPVWKGSRSGQAVAAIRNNEQLAESVGIDTFRYYLGAFVFAATLAGLAGVVYAHFVQQVSPQGLSLYYMFWLLVMVVVGGSGTTVGPILGAGVFVFVPEFLEAAQEFRMVAFGVLLLVTIIFLPKGIYPTLRSAAVALFTRVPQPRAAEPATRIAPKR